MPPEIHRKRVETLRKYYRDIPEYHQRRSALSRLLWSDKAYVRKQIQARQVHPNRPEVFLLSQLESWFPETFEYVGDGQVVIGKRCPDFIERNGGKHIIEFMGTCWHESSDEEGRVAYYTKHGFSCLVIWQRELKNLDLLKGKLSQFIGGHKAFSTEYGV